MHVRVRVCVCVHVRVSQLHDQVASIRAYSPHAGHLRSCNCNVLIVAQLTITRFTANQLSMNNPNCNE